MKRSKSKNIWEITHQAVVTGTMVYSTTHVKAKTAKKALSFFNKKIADGRWTYKAKIGDVKQLEVYEAE